jgi:hypothetical protein
MSKINITVSLSAVSGMTAIMFIYRNTAVTKYNKKFWEELTAYFPFIQHDHIENNASNYWRQYFLCSPP